MLFKIYVNVCLRKKKKGGYNNSSSGRSNPNPLLVLLLRSHPTLHLPPLWLTDSQQSSIAVQSRCSSSLKPNCYPFSAFKEIVFAAKAAKWQNKCLPPQAQWERESCFWRNTEEEEEKQQPRGERERAKVAVLSTTPVMRCSEQRRRRTS